MIAYKFLRADGTSRFTGFSWPAPSDGPGAWVEAVVDPCRSGIHACRPSDLPYWAGRVLYEVELDGEVVQDATKIVAPRGRLLRRIDAWEAERDAYTRMCADRAHALVDGAGPEFAHWKPDIEPSLPEGPAMLGFIAALVAEEIAGSPDAYHAERARQTAWLTERLGLDG
jgi:hypothetical protein